MGKNKTRRVSGRISSQALILNNMRRLMQGGDMGEKRRIGKSCQKKLSSSMYHQHYANCFGIVSISALLLLTLLTLSPWCPDGANAEEIQPRAVAGDDTLSVSLDANVDLLFTPMRGGSFSSDTASLRIASGNKDGYTAYISTLGSSGSMTQDNGRTGEIAAISGTATAESMNNNWGYALTKENVSPTTYQGISTDQEILVSTETASTDFYDLSVAAKVDFAVPSGRYTNEVLVSVVANPAKVTDLTSITYMQEMNSDICQHTSLNRDDPDALTSTNDYSKPVTKQLIDKRDNKPYYVARLADGNCWMTQNLDLDINATTGLTSADTDLNGAANGTGSEAGLAVWKSGNTGVDTDGAAKVAPSTTETSVPSAQYNPPQTGTRSWSLSQTGEHYYQWNTATAGSGGNIVNEDARDSICPKGWRLPNAGNRIGDNPITYDSGSLGYMLNKYGISSNSNGTGIDGKTYDVFSTPLSFKASGYVSVDQTYYGLRNTGTGYFWLSYGTDTARAYLAQITNNWVSPHYSDPNYRRYFGLSIRCLAQ